MAAFFSVGHVLAYFTEPERGQRGELGAGAAKTLRWSGKAVSLIVMLTHTAKKITLSVAAGLLVLPLAACGGASSDQEAAASTLTNFYSGFANKDFQKVCASLDPTLRQSQFEGAGMTCPQVMEKGSAAMSTLMANASKAEVDAKKIEINGDNATAPQKTVKVGDNTYDATSYKLVKKNGNWLISSLS